MGRQQQTTGSAFWDDLNRDLHDPEFRRAYVTDALRIRMIDQLVNSLDARREAIGWSKADLARAIGRRPAVVRRLLSASKRNPPLSTYLDVAAALGMEIEVKVAEEPQPVPVRGKRRSTRHLAGSRS